MHQEVAQNTIYQCLPYKGKYPLFIELTSQQHAFYAVKYYTLYTLKDCISTLSYHCFVCHAYMFKMLSLNTTYVHCWYILKNLIYFPQLPWKL